MVVHSLGSIIGAQVKIAEHKIDNRYDDSYCEGRCKTQGKIAVSLFLFELPHCL